LNARACHHVGIGSREKDPIPGEHVGGGQDQPQGQSAEHHEPNMFWEKMVDAGKLACSTKDMADRMKALER
jgi:hypothetical protein